MHAFLPSLVKKVPHRSQRLCATVYAAKTAHWVFPERRLVVRIGDSTSQRRELGVANAELLRRDSQRRGGVPIQFTRVLVLARNVTLDVLELALQLLSPLSLFK